MSLINDALKNARRSQEQQPPGPPGAPPLPPVETPPRIGGGLGWFCLVLLILIMAGIFISQAFVVRKSPAQNPPVVSAESSQPVAPKIIPPAPPTTNIVVAAKPAPPVLKLQAIFVNATPQAIVNGQTVYVGDTVDGFRVKTISKNSVSFVAPNGTEKTLALGE